MEKTTLARRFVFVDFEKRETLVDPVIKTLGI